MNKLVYIIFFISLLLSAPQVKAIDHYGNPVLTECPSCKGQGVNNMPVM